MNRYWDDHPPLHFMVAAYLGIKPKTASKGNAEDIVSFLGAFPGAAPAPSDSE
jgi:hypothetical protein